jgi:hypothetical protein
MMAAAGNLRKISRALGLGRPVGSASLEVEARCALQQTFPVISAQSLGRVKTKSDFGSNAERKTNFWVFFALRITVEPKIWGAAIPLIVFTQRGSKPEVDETNRRCPI